ncbi:MAG: FCD domain-containing protein [Terracoccus sp.]
MRATSAAGAAPSGAGKHADLLDQLGSDLVDGHLVPGAVLSTEQVEQRYGVSRSIAREAVKVLESMGVVASRRRVGITVRPEEEWDALSPLIVRWRLAGPGREAELQSLSELRSGIEPVAARLAAGRASVAQQDALASAAAGMSSTGRRGDLEAYLRHDAVFHHTLLRASGNPMLARFGDLVEEVLAGRTHHHLMPSNPNPQAIDWHREVADAIASRDAAAAEAGMALIVAEAQSAMTAQLAVSPD